MELTVEKLEVRTMPINFHKSGHIKKMACTVGMHHHMRVIHLLDDNRLTVASYGFSKFTTLE